MPPLISIGLPTYNRASSLRQSLPSILSQDFHDFEIVIINNGSTDDTASVLEEFQQQDHRIKVHHNPFNRGVVPVHNQVFRLCQGRYFIYGSDDDQWLPYRLSSLWALMGEGHGLSAVCTSYDILRSGAPPLSPILHPFSSNKEDSAFLALVKKPDYRLSLALISLERLHRQDIRLVSLNKDMGAYADIYFLQKLNLAGEVRFSEEVTLIKTGANEKHYQTPFTSGQTTRPVDYLNHLLLIWKKTSTDCLLHFPRPGLETAWKAAFDGHMVEHIFYLLSYLHQQPEGGEALSAILTLVKLHLQKDPFPEAFRLISFAEALDSFDQDLSEWEAALQPA